jgi:hypothetical protein
MGTGMNTDPFATYESETLQDIIDDRERLVKLNKIYEKEIERLRVKVQELSMQLNNLGKRAGTTGNIHGDDPGI